MDEFFFLGFSLDASVYDWDCKDMISDILKLLNYPGVWLDWC
jgi:hypothetical protein